MRGRKKTNLEAFLYETQASLDLTFELAKISKR